MICSESDTEAGGDSRSIEVLTRREPDIENPAPALTGDLPK